MARFLGVVFVAALVSGLGGTTRAGGDKDAGAIVDRAIKAAGGAEKLGALKAFTTKAKGKITFNDQDNPFTSQVTVQGLDHLHSEFEGEFGGMKVKGITVMAGDKGWRKFGDMDLDMDKDAVANEKRSLYLQVVPITLVPLKGPGFKVQGISEEKVAGKPAVGLKVTGPDGKDFKLYFDKETVLPAKLVAKVVGYMGEEFTQETAYGNYKDFDGIRRATRIQSKRDGMPFIEQEVTDFRALQKVDPKTFAQPK